MLAVLVALVAQSVQCFQFSTLLPILRTHARSPTKAPFNEAQLKHDC